MRKTNNNNQFNVDDLVKENVIKENEILKNYIQGKYTPEEVYFNLIPILNSQRALLDSLNEGK